MMMMMMWTAPLRLVCEIEWENGTHTHTHTGWHAKKTTLILDTHIIYDCAEFGGGRVRNIKHIKNPLE